MRLQGLARFVRDAGRLGDELLLLLQQIKRWRSLFSRRKHHSERYTRGSRHN